MPRARSLPETLRPAANYEWAFGAYYRAHVLQKNRADVEPAAYVLKILRDKLGDEGYFDPDIAILRARAEHLYGRTLIRLGAREGRDILVDLYQKSTRLPVDGRLDRFLSDLCGDLSNIGLHHEAITTTESLIGRAPDNDVRARRRGNLAAWYLQRAVAHRAGRRDAAAWSDLDAADREIEPAIQTWDEDDKRRPTRTTRLQLREALAVRASVTVERSAVPGYGGEEQTRAMLDAADELRRLLAESLTPPRDETYLQVVYRIGRLGIYHIRTAAHRDGTFAQLKRGRAYLEHAWRSTGNACVRPWLALDLLEALEVCAAADDPAAVRDFALEAIDRLTPQCGSDYEAVTALAESL